MEVKLKDGLNREQSQEVKERSQIVKVELQRREGSFNGRFDPSSCRSILYKNFLQNILMINFSSVGHIDVDPIMIEITLVYKPVTEIRSNYK